MSILNTNTENRFHMQRCQKIVFVDSVMRLDTM